MRWHIGYASGVEKPLSAGADPLLHWWHFVSLIAEIESAFQLVCARERDLPFVLQAPGNNARRYAKRVCTVT